MIKTFMVGATAALAFTGAAQAASLYGVSLNGQSNGTDSGNSLLYSVDEVTGVGTLIGDIGYDVNSIAIDPISGLMYASTTTWSGAFNGLLQVDTTTGAATEVGAFGGAFNAILGLSFDAAGNLFGWHDPFADDAVSIDVATGAATSLGNSGLNTAAHLVAFDGNGDLIVVQDNSVYEIDTGTGASTLQTTLSFDPGAGGAAFGPSGQLWASSLSGQEMDSMIQVTDIANDSSFLIDTNIEYLNALTWGDTAGSMTPIPLPAGLPLLLAGLGTLGFMRRRKNKS